MANLQIIPKRPEKFRPYSGNARTHWPKQIAEIAACIRAVGFNNPVLIDSDNGIVAGLTCFATRQERFGRSDVRVACGRKLWQSWR
jgi:hypothetical protein